MCSVSHPARPDRSAALIRRLLFLCLFFLLTPGIPALHAKSVPLNQHWEYRWGDSPFKDDIPLWTIEADAVQWQAIDFPANPPDRNGQENIWYKTLIPQDEWRDPVLYISSIDLIVEAYVDGKRIYHYGEFDTEGKGHFEGWPWHMIPLPADAAGKPIYFRIYSDYIDIGFWGEIKIMDRLELYEQILLDSISNLVITVFSLLIAALSFLFAMFKTERTGLLALSLFSLASAGLALGSSQAKQLLIHHQLMWEYISAGSYYLLPIALAFILQGWFNRLQKFYRSLAALFLAYFIGALGLSLIGVVSLADTYPPFDILFAVLVPAMLLGTLRLLPQASTDQRIMLLTTTLITLLLLLDMAVAHTWISWNRVPVGWGSLLFSLSIVFLSLRHFIHTQKALAILNTTLEKRVTERTQELKILARREADRARSLEFGSSKRVLLDEIINEVEQCTDVQQAMSILTARLPELCAPLPGGLYLIGEHHWQLTQQWGKAKLPTQQPISGHLQIGTEWHPFLIEYDEPHKGRQKTALLLANLNKKNINFEQLNPLTLHILFTRAIDRVNLTLSKIVLQQALSRFSYEDALTGLKNRRYLDEMLTREIGLAHRNHTALAVMICDIDYFKQLNDCYGHPAGDEVLKNVARLLHTTFRKTDIICRFGGEEFVVVMPAATLADCHERTERLRLSMASQEFIYGEASIGSVTLSAGVSALSTQNDDPDSLLHRADTALYQAKASGRNRVMCAETESVPAAPPENPEP